jgi:hypothetical protein
MRKAGRFPEPRFTICGEFVELGIAFVGVGLKDAACIAQVGQHMLRFPVGSIAVGDPGRRGAGPGALITDITPDPALHHTLADTFGASFRSQHADGCIVGVQDVAAQDRCFDPVGHGLQDPHRAATPIGKRAAWYVRQNLVLPVQRQMVVDFETST